MPPRLLIMQKHLKAIVAIGVVGIGLIVWSQSTQNFTQSIRVQNNDNNIKLQLIGGNQTGQDWINCSDGTNEIFAITSKGNITTTKTNTSSITATGFTNSGGGNCVAYVTGNGVSITNFDGKGNVYMTNAITTGCIFTIDMQEGAFFRAPSGLSGSWHSF